MAHRKLRRLRRCLIIPVAAALLLGPVGPASGQTDAVPTVTVTANAVELAWPVYPDATTYLVIDDRTHQVIWRGDQTSAQLPVQAPTSVSALIVALTDSGPHIVAKTLTTVPDPKSSLTTLTAVTTDDGTRLTWGALPDVKEYAVTADGQEVARTSGSPLDVAATLGQKVKYEITADRDLPATEISNETVTSYSYGVAISPATTNVSQASTTSQAGDTLPAGIPNMVSSRTTYETYIPSQYINAPDFNSLSDCESGDGSDYWYSGDNRSAGFDTGKYRTKAAINQFWTDISAFTSEVVSPTHRYKRLDDGSMVYDSSRTFDADTFRSSASNDGRKSIANIGHIVGNPYCSRMNTIDYFNKQELYTNGGYMISGGHDKMPNHQFFRSDRYSDGTMILTFIFHHELDSPLCLNPLFCGGMREYQYAG